MLFRNLNILLTSTSPQNRPHTNYSRQRAIAINPRFKSSVKYKKINCRFSAKKQLVDFAVVKELDEETNLYYYGARYLDPRTSRWIAGDPAIWQGDYIPVAPVNDEARKHNQNLPGMGGIFNIVNMHAYHYAGNNPVKYVDPDGRTPRPPRPPISQRSNNLPPTNSPYNNQSSYQYIVTRYNQAERLSSVIENLNANKFSRSLDAVFNGRRYRTEAMRYQMRAYMAYRNAIFRANNLYRIEGVTEYPDSVIDRYIEMVNSEMIFNFPDQRELGPYEGTVTVPRIDRATARYELTRHYPSVQNNANE